MAQNEDVISATKASDLIFTAVKLSKINFEELSKSLFTILSNCTGPLAADETDAYGRVISVSVKAQED